MLAVITSALALTLIAWGVALLLYEEHPYREGDPIALAFALLRTAWGWRKTRPWRSTKYPEASVPMLRYVMGAGYSLAWCLIGCLARHLGHPVLDLRRRAAYLLSRKVRPT